MGENKLEDDLVIPTFLKRTGKAKLEDVFPVTDWVPIRKASQKDPSEEKITNVQDNIRYKISNMIADIDDIVDDNIFDFNLYDHLIKVDFPASMTGRLADHYEPIANELNEALEGKDPELKEGYRSYTKKQLRNIAGLYTNIVDNARRYATTQKKQRKATVRKAKPADKQITKLKYQKEAIEYKVTSITPSKIVGASEIWLFNTKYLTISVIRAIDRGGLKVKGTSILNYDEATSMTKKAGRKIEEYIKVLIDGGKRDLNKLMDNITTKPSAFTNRTSENTIIMRILT